MDNLKYCINCKNLNKNQLNHYVCGLTNLLTESTNSCESYEYRNIQKDGRKIPKYLIAILIAVALFFIPRLMKLNEAVEKKELKEEYVRCIEANKRKIHFVEYIEGERTEGHKKYNGIFYTQDSLSPYRRFEVEFDDFFYKLPESVSKEDTVIIRNTLFYIRPDSSFKEIHVIEGFSINFYTGRRFDIIE